MPVEIAPETVLTHLKEGRLGPLYLFYGPDDFHLEKVLETDSRNIYSRIGQGLQSSCF